MRAIVFTIALTLLSAVAVAEESQGDIDAFLERCEKARPAMIAAAKAKIDAAKNELTLINRATVDRRLVGQVVAPPVPGKPPVFASTRAKADAVADKQKALAAARDRLALLERGEMPIPSLPAKPNVGDIGRLESGVLAIDEIIDDTNMVCVTKDYACYWLRGWPTANLLESQEFDLTGKVVKAAAIKIYEPRFLNATENRLAVLEPFDIDQARAAWDKRQSKAK
jgi:hypothetical protein